MKQLSNNETTMVSGGWALNMLIPQDMLDVALNSTNCWCYSMPEYDTAYAKVTGKCLTDILKSPQQYMADPFSSVGLTLNRCTLYQLSDFFLYKCPTKA